LQKGGRFIDTPKNVGIKQPEMNKLYLQYFVTLNNEDEDTSLIQPSPFEFVESFTSDGAAEKTIIGST